jgi:hypothetical protein
LKLGKLMMLLVLALITWPFWQSAMRPSDCEVLAEVYRDFAISDGFSSFDAFLEEKLVVETRLVGFAWKQTVVYPNPKVSSAFGRQLATEVSLDHSLLSRKASYLSINIPLAELDTEIARQHVCGE